MLYKLGSSSSKNLEDHVDVNILHEILKEKLQYKHADKIKQVVKSKMKTPEGLKELMEMTALDADDLVRYLIRLFPEIFTSKFCKNLRFNFFDKSCNICIHVKTSTGVCKYGKRHQKFYVKHNSVCVYYKQKEI